MISVEPYITARGLFKNEAVRVFVSALRKVFQAKYRNLDFLKSSTSRNASLSFIHPDPNIKD